MIIIQIHKTNEDYEFYLKKFIELHHSRAVKAIHESGGVSNAVDFLNITQSSPNHQSK